MVFNEQNSLGRVLAKSAVLGSLVVYFILVSLFPFYYQTQTLWYKFGIDRTLLIAGQLAGIYAASLVCLQLVLIVRPPILAGIFGAAQLTGTHRVMGRLIPVIVLVHLLLVLVPEGLGNLPFGKKFWPEMVGGLVFFLLLCLAVSNWLRQKLAIPYPRWKTGHRLLGLLAWFGIGVHVAFVSDAFKQTVPVALLLILFVSVLLTYAYGKWRQRK